MSLLLRARIASFLAGVAVTGVYGVYLLREDVRESHRVLREQAQQGTQALDRRVAALEARLAQAQQAQAQQAQAQEAQAQQA